MVVVHVLDDIVESHVLLDVESRQDIIVVFQNGSHDGLGALISNDRGVKREAVERTLLEDESMELKNEGRWLEIWLCFYTWQ